LCPTTALQSDFYDDSIEIEQESFMSDDKNKVGGQDRERINVHEEYELRDWAKTLNTTPERIKEAVQAVGDRADQVRGFLGQGGSRREH
jgi:hypothetical protein